MRILINDAWLDEETIEKLTAAFQCTVQELENIIKRVVRIEMPFSYEELKENLYQLEKYVFVPDDIHQQYIKWCRESWHTHHKEGKPCKAKIPPQYWHRIRSFCVRNNYH